MIKAVLQAIPTYIMQCFKVPEGICDEIHKLCAEFWWGDKEEKRRMHWARWKALCKPKAQGGLGFRDMKAFNQALLAKQIWRMIKYPQTLVSRIFKARYYPNCDVLQAHARPQCSYVWRSIIGSKYLVERGIRWRVGDGRNISILNDRWVSGTWSGQVKGLAGGRNTAGMVQELITRDGQWNVRKLEERFPAFEISAILLTPIGEKSKNDERWWALNESGAFSVKSAYHFHDQQLDAHDHSSDHDKKWWCRHVWHTTLPPKVKVFLWRVFRDFIPAPGNLKAHHVPSDGICPLCKDRWGSSSHVLFVCPRIRTVWKCSKFKEFMSKGDGMEAGFVAAAIRQQFSEEDYEVWCLMAWQVWRYVCRMLHEDEPDAHVPIEVECAALRDTHLKARRLYRGTPSVKLQCGEKTWLHPSKGTYRVDVDVLFNKDAGLFGVGVVIRDWNGALIAALSARKPPRSNVMLAEALAIVDGIVFCIEQNIHPIVIFTDSLLAAKIMAGDTKDADFLPEDIADVLQVARENILIGIFHMYRTANRVAHCLAQFAATLSSQVVWREAFPVWLTDIVRLDN